MQNITFTNFLSDFHAYDPEPAKKYIPDWYKNLNSYITGIKEPGMEQNTSTIKRCMPVFDVLTSGYLLFTPCDVYVNQRPYEDINNFDKTLPYFTCPKNFYPVIEFHNEDQFKNYPNNTGHKYSLPKWINGWGIKTPKNYSILITPPFHRQSVFQILPGIVDTDKYNLPINFPFMLNDPKFNGLIPGGTPMAQIIPFKRDQWKKEIGNKHEILKMEKNAKFMNSKIFDIYKDFFREKKEYN